MKKYLFLPIAAVMLIPAAGYPQMGLLNNLRDRITGGRQEEPPPPPEPTPAPAERRGQQGQQQTQRTQSGTQVRMRDEAVDAQSMPTPDPAKVRQGAERLRRQLAVDPIPRDLLRRYVGNWEGNFWVYTPGGEKKQVVKAQMACTLQEDGSLVMKSRMFDMISQVWATEETSVYRVQGNRVIVDISRPTGNKDKQIGQYSDGSLFLKAEIKDGVESFRERIDGNRLLIDGFGVYGKIDGKDHNVFVGRFTRK